MSARLAFDYVIVQVVPRVDRDERLNVGVILFCPAAAFLGATITDDLTRVRALAPDLDAGAVERQLEAIRAICAGRAHAGPIALLSASERFHWLSAPRSTVVQPAAAHAGLCTDPADALARLFRAVVGLERGQPLVAAKPRQ